VCFGSGTGGTANVYPIVSGFEELKGQHLSAEIDMLA
jgi:hypothetical protein